MLASLKNLIFQVIQSSEHVAQSSKQLTKSAEESAIVSSKVAETITEVAEGTDRQVKAVEAANLSGGNTNLSSNWPNCA